jgi:hypothetical protein
MSSSTCVSGRRGLVVAMVGMQRELPLVRAVLLTRRL